MVFLVLEMIRPIRLTTVDSSSSDSVIDSTMMDIPWTCSLAKGPSEMASWNPLIILFSNLNLAEADWLKSLLSEPFSVESNRTFGPIRLGPNVTTLSTIPAQISAFLES
ncbi:hypothetical protein WICPIJ_003364 [Wickerhamomyces pijperi]|uniref:Uncharacterized protein n=1 Tax=Wickerhamomyces pijperi TaxID=599730 RepID=A0A9P8Q9R5_WICPI|nr:hypothetical protein WICPIJ_003364 [Wickerhamomyces pijperi]